MTRCQRLLLFAIPVLAGIGCGKGSDDPVLADVGSKQVRVSDMKLAYENMKPTDRPALATLEDKKQFLDDLINKQVMEVIAFQKYPDLTEPQTWRLKRFREKTLTDEVRQRLIKNEVVVTDAMKDTLYANMSRQRKLMGMLIPDPDAARYVRKKLDEGASFESLARDYSMQWVSKESAGDMGWTDAGTLPYPVDVRVWSAPVGSTIGPFDEPMGSYIIRVVDERPNEVKGSRADLDGALQQKIMEPLYMNRQKAVQDSLKQAADPYYPAEAKALLTMKYFWEPPEEKRGDPMAVLDAQRVVPTFTDSESKIVVVDFKNAPDWTAKEFSDRLSWYPGGLWPRGQSEDQLMDCLNMMVRDYLYLKAAKDMGMENEDLERKIDSMSRQMRVTYYYYNDVMAKYAPKQAEIDDYFQTHRDDFRAPESYKVAFFADKNKQLIENLHKDLVGGMSFADIRKKYEPQDKDLVTIGESEWIYTGQDVVRDDLISTLKEGGVSDPVTRSDVTMIYKLIARRPSRQLTYQEAKETVDKQAKAAIVDKKLTDFLNEQRDKMGVKIHEKALADVEMPSEEAAPAKAATS